MASSKFGQTPIANGCGRRLIFRRSPARQRLYFILYAALVALVFLVPARNLTAQSGRKKTQPSPSPPGTLRPRSIITPSLPTVAPSPSPTPAAPSASPGTAPTSDIEEIDPGDIVRVNANLVTIPAFVVDSQGKAVTNLTLEDFELRVEGQPKEISEVNHSETPVRMVLLFDNSMSLLAARDFEKQAAIKFLRRVLRPIDQTAIYSIYTYPILAQHFTSDVNALVRTIENFPLPEDGATALFDTMIKAADLLRPFDGRKVIVIVSDGADTVSEVQDFDLVLQRMLAADCQIYAVQTGQNESVNLYNLAAYRRLQEFTSQTGGAVFVPKVTRDLDSAFAQIAEDLSQQYVLSYYPVDDKRDGRFRTISLKIAKRPSLRVRARKGYYPPKG